jgi:hypothetical protein
MTFDNNEAAAGVTLFGPLGAVLGENITQKIGEQKDYSQVNDTTSTLHQSIPHSPHKDESLQEIVKRLAETSVNTLRKAGIIGKNTKVNTPIVVYIGNKLFGGMIDTITFTNTENLFINEWKFTEINVGGPGDDATRGMWAFQLTVYLYMYKQALEEVKKSLESSQECAVISPVTAKWLGLNGESADEWKDDLYKRIGAYGKESGMKAYIARAFDADGESLVELITASVSNLDILKAIIMLTGMAQ